MFTDTVSNLCLSPCNKYLIVADLASNVVVWRRASDVAKWILHYKLPKYNCVPNALAVHPTNGFLVIAYSDQKVVCCSYTCCWIILNLCFRSLSLIYNFVNLRSSRGSSTTMCCVDFSISFFRFGPSLSMPRIKTCSLFIPMFTS